MPLACAKLAVMILGFGFGLLSRHGFAVVLALGFCQNMAQVDCSMAINGIFNPICHLVKAANGISD